MRNSAVPRTRVTSATLIAVRKRLHAKRELIQTYRSHRKYAKMHEHERRLAAIEPVVRERKAATLSIAAEGAGRGPAEPLRLSEASIGYREPAQVEITRARSLALRRGERVGIVGPNECGKIHSAQDHCRPLAST